MGEVLIEVRDNFQRGWANHSANKQQANCVGQFLPIWYCDGNNENIRFWGKCGILSL